MATRPSLSRALALLVAATLSIATITLVPGTGAADPDLTIEEVQARVDALYEEAEAATERAHEIDLEVADAKRRLDTLQAQIKKQEREYEGLREVLADMAADMYATGGIDPSMQMMLSAEPQDFLLQAQSLDQVMRSQDADLRRAETAGLALEQSKLRADQELERLRGLQEEAQKEKDAANAKLEEAKELLSRLKAEERERLERLQEQRAAAAAAAARATPAASNPTPTPTISGSGRGATAAAYARAQVGKPYVFGAAGPSAFDCSGLTMAAWASAGVGLPHAASAQYGMTTRVDSGSLIPGDLVFFYSDLHHVGIYVGGGMFVHAANPSDGVVMEGLFSSYWQSVYMGAGRV
ncbi:MAG TPA: NlpC/P60 family protein [Actinomycetes bacterium]|nr:NlpC/P60 family protein [Actinomycetes bacterium]